MTKNKSSRWKRFKSSSSPPQEGQISFEVVVENGAGNNEEGGNGSGTGTGAALEDKGFDDEKEEDAGGGNVMRNPIDCIEEPEEAVGGEGLSPIDTDRDEDEDGDDDENEDDADIEDNDKNNNNHDDDDDDNEHRIETEMMCKRHRMSVRKRKTKTLGVSLLEYRNQCREQHRKRKQEEKASNKGKEKEVKKKSKKSRFSYKHRRNEKDEIVSGKRKKRSALHGTGASKWYEAKNWYYVFLDWSWTFIFTLIVIQYILACVFFSLLSWGGSKGIECEVGETTLIPGTFLVASVFATSNVLTLGYGPCLPATAGMFFFASIQQFYGIIVNVVVFSIVVSKFQIPKPDIVFSRHALVTTRDHKPVLLIRVGNRRVNLLYQCRVSFSVLQFRSTVEGERYVEHVPLKVEFPPTMTAVATMIHRINRNSPLREFLLDQENLENIAFSLSFVALDSIYNEELSCTTQYKGVDMQLGGILFGDMMERLKSGKGLRANFDKFDDVKPALNASLEDLQVALQSMSDDEYIGEDHEDEFWDNGIISEDDEIYAGNSEQVVPERTRRRSKSRSRTTIASKKSSSVHSKMSMTSNFSKQQQGSRLDNVLMMTTSMTMITNDMSGETVALEPPKKMKPNTVYLVYGNLRVKNHFVRVCPYCRIVFMLLVEAGIPFQVIDIDWENKPQWFLDIQTNGRTPLIHLNGKWIPNSRDIIRALNKAFPDLGESLNKAHDLPTAPFNFMETVERYGYPVLFSTKEKFLHMLELENKKKEEMNGDEKTSCAVVSFSKSTQMLQQQSTNNDTELKFSQPLKLERVWREMPPANTTDLYLLIPVRHRVDVVVKACPESTAVEMLIRTLKIPFYIALIDIENPPDWLDFKLPALFGGLTTGSEEIKHSGSVEISNYLSKTLYPEKFAKLPHRLDIVAVHDMSDRIYETTKNYILRKDEDEDDDQELKSMFDVIENALAASSANDVDEIKPSDDSNDNILSWHPYLSGEKEIGIDDLFLAPMLRYVSEGILKALDNFDLAVKGYKRIDAYIKGMSNTELMRQCCLVEEIGPFYALQVSKNLESEFGSQNLPKRCKLTKAKIDAEKKAIRKIYSEYGKDTLKYYEEDGSISVDGGCVGPPFEMNYLYLGVGCIKRSSDDLVKICPYSRVIEFVCAEANIPFQVVRIDLLKKPEWFTKASNGKCPNLYWNGVWYSESSLILKLVRDLFPQKIGALSIPHEIDTPSIQGKAGMDLFNASDAIFDAFLLAKQDDDDDNDGEVERKKKPVIDLLTAFEENLRNGSSEQELKPTVDEIALICSLWRYLVLLRWFKGFKVEQKFPAVEKWIKSFQTRDSFKKSIPPFAEESLIFYHAQQHKERMTPLIESNHKLAITKAKLVMNPDKRSNSWCELVQYKSIIQVLEDLLEQNQGVYLCGKSIGLADLLVFSQLHFHRDILATYHSFNFGDHFPKVNEYLELIQESPRFRTVVSDAVAPLFRIHMGNRLANVYPHLSLSRSERESCERKAKKIIELRMRRIKHKSSSSKGSIEETGSIRSNTSGSSNEESAGDVEDLLFCI